MSLFNMVLGGDGDGFKTASVTSSSSNSITFTVDSDPKEYCAMLTFPSISGGAVYNDVMFVCDTDTYELLGYLAPEFWTNHFRTTGLGYVSRSYANRQFTLTLTTSTYEFRGEDYTLFYR